MSIDINKCHYDENRLADLIVQNQAKFGHNINREQGKEYVKQILGMAQKKLKKNHPFARVSKKIEGFTFIKEKYLEEYQKIVAEILFSLSA
jgi:hypothetical protein